MPWVNIHISIFQFCQSFILFHWVKFHFSEASGNFAINCTGDRLLLLFVSKLKITYFVELDRNSQINCPSCLVLLIMDQLFCHPYPDRQELHWMHLAVTFRPVTLYQLFISVIKSITFRLKRILQCARA